MRVKDLLQIFFLLLALVGNASLSTAATLINGAGATFPYPLYSKWFDEFSKGRPDIRFNYQAIGSGGGIRQISERTVDFGATDAPMTDEQMRKSNVALLHFPTVLGGVVPTYNLPEVRSEINFTPHALAGIFLGKITRWNDPEIAKANPSMTLPDKPIAVVHRSDGSGTTYVWVEYLAKVSPQWKEQVGVGTSVKWPVGLGGKGNEGVTGMIKQIPYAIGYVELIYAERGGLSIGRVQNQTGAFIKADLNSITAAGASTKIPQDFRVSLTNAPGKASYPISNFTWLLIPQQISDPVKGKAMVDFLRWMLREGQTLAPHFTYAPLPKEVVQMAETAIVRTYP